MLDLIHHIETLLLLLLLLLLMLMLLMTIMSLDFKTNNDNGTFNPCLLLQMMGFKKDLHLFYITFRDENCILRGSL
jgi:hypothetical protein